MQKKEKIPEIKKSEIHPLNRRIFNYYTPEQMIEKIHEREYCLEGINTWQYRNFDINEMIQNTASTVFDENKGKWKYIELEQEFKEECQKRKIRYSQKLLKHFVLNKWESNSPDFGVSLDAHGERYDLRKSPIKNAKECIKTHFEDLALDTFDDIGGTEGYIEGYFNDIEKKGKYFPVLKKLY